MQQKQPPILHQSVQSSSVQFKSPGQGLRWHRLHLGLSQEALAEALGVSARSVRRWEQDLAIPQEIARQRLCTQFGIDAGQLLGALPVEDLSPVPPPIWWVPFHRNPFFTGREAILQQLHATLCSNKIATMTQALSGLGGIGKTQTAVEYAYHFRDHYQALLWVQADSREVLLASVAALAAVLDLSEQRDADQRQTVHAVQRWLQYHSQWLLIVDNLEELDLVEECFPGSGGQIIVTTRAHATGTLANRIELAPMSLQEGASFLAPACQTAFSRSFTRSSLRVRSGRGRGHFHFVGRVASRSRSGRGLRGGDRKLLSELSGPLSKTTALVTPAAW